MSVVPKQMSGVVENKHKLILNREKVHQIPEVRESLQRSSGDSGESRVTAKFESEPRNENYPIKQSLAGPGNKQ